MSDDLIADVTVPAVCVQRLRILHKPQCPLLGSLRPSPPSTREAKRRGNDTGPRRQQEAAAVHAGTVGRMGQNVNTPSVQRVEPSIEHLQFGLGGRELEDAEEGGQDSSPPRGEHSQLIRARIARSEAASSGVIQRSNLTPHGHTTLSR